MPRSGIGRNRRARVMRCRGRKASKKGTRQRRLLLNDLGRSAMISAASDEDHWAVKPLFKALRRDQKLNAFLNTFLGTAPPVARIRVWTALIGMLMTHLAHWTGQWGRSTPDPAA